MDEDSTKKTEESSDDVESEAVRPRAEGAPPRAESGLRSSREDSFSRRALIRAGWSVPVIMAVTPPRAYAQGSPLPGHVDSGGHSDVSHADGAHFDSGGHSDRAVMNPHIDVLPFHTDTTIHTDSGGHSDRAVMNPHIDSLGGHTDAAHGDGVVHTDVPHADS